jgi:hypothetical protein
MKGRYQESKSLSEKKHAMKRVRQRYDLVLSSDDYKDLILNVKHGKAETLYRESNRVSVKSLLYKGQQLFFVYDNNRSRIVTFLDKEMVDMELAKLLAVEKVLATFKPPCKNPATWEEFKAQTVSL